MIVSRASQWPYWFICLSIVFSLTLPTLVQDGMFMDAVLYSSVSHNLSLGVGSFWFPQFSLHNPAGLQSFHEQPPLIFGIQSLFFKVLGSSMYVERFYTLVCILFNIWLIALFWKKVHQTSYERITGWLPVLFWIIIPVCFWSYSSNMHENTLSIFALAACIFSYQSMEHEDRYWLWYSILAAFFVVLATLSKGLPGFFPLVLPLIHFAVYGGKSTLIKSLKKFLIPIFAVAFCYVVLFIIPHSRESLSLYFFKRALYRINEVNTVNSHFYIVGKMAMELLVPSLLLLLIWIFTHLIKTKKVLKPDLNHTLFFFLLGISSSFPLMLTKVQKGFYLVPSFPYFGLAFASVAIPYVSGLKNQLEYKAGNSSILKVVSLVLMLGSIVFTASKFGKTSRNEEMIHDVHNIGKTVSNGNIISLPEELWNYWDLQCYLMRYYQISVEPNSERTFFLSEKNKTEGVPNSYKRVELDTKQFDLFIKTVE